MKIYLLLSYVVTMVLFFEPFAHCSDQLSKPVTEDNSARNKSVARSVRSNNDVPDLKVLLLAMQKKEMELKAARDEISRLKGYIAQIGAANRREQATMAYNLGCIYKLYKMYSKAEEAFLKAATLNPSDPSVQYNLGILYDDDLNDDQKAKIHYKAFLKLAPDDPDAPTVREWLATLQ